MLSLWIELVRPIAQVFAKHLTIPTPSERGRRRVCRALLDLYIYVRELRVRGEQFETSRLLLAVNRNSKAHLETVLERWRFFQEGVLRLGGPIHDISLYLEFERRELARELEHLFRGKLTVLELLSEVPLESDGRLIRLIPNYTSSDLIKALASIHTYKYIDRYKQTGSTGEPKLHEMLIQDLVADGVLSVEWVDVQQRSAYETFLKLAKVNKKRISEAEDSLIELIKENCAVHELFSARVP